MFTKEHLLQAMAQVPDEFSLEELAAILSQARPATASVRLPSPFANFILSQADQAAERAYYTSPEAKTVYAKFSASPALRALRGIASQLSAEDLGKTAKDWEAERIQAKYGL